MKKGIIICMIAILAYESIIAQECTTDDDEKETVNHHLKFATLLEYTFGKKTDLNNFIPEIFLGFDTQILSRNNANQVLRLRFGPSICAGSIKIDSGNYFRPLMLPGTINLSFTIYGAQLLLNKQLGFFAYTGSNFKSIGFAENDKTIIQNNIVGGVGFEYLKLLLISIDHTWGWHNVTEESEVNFNNIYITDNTNVSYISLNVESYSQLLKMYFTFTWRNFLDHENFCEGSFSDTRTISIGMRKDLQLVSYAGCKNK